MKKHTKINLQFGLLIIIAIVLTLGLAFKYYKYINKVSRNFAVFGGVEGLKTANFWAPYSKEDGPEYPYLISYQIKYPKDYFVTNINLYNYYRTQGGGGFPNLILTKEDQFTNPYETESQAMDELYRSGVECILVSNYYTGNLDEEKTQTANDGFIVSQEQIQIKDFPAVLRVLETTRRENTLPIKRYDAVLKLPEDVFYHFETCNLENKEDLMTVMESFNFRGVQNN